MIDDSTISIACILINERRQGEFLVAFLKFAKKTFQKLLTSVLVMSIIRICQ